MKMKLLTSLFALALAGQASAINSITLNYVELENNGNNATGVALGHNINFQTLSHTGVGIIPDIPGVFPNTKYSQIVDYQVYGRDDSAPASPPTLLDLGGSHINTITNVTSNGEGDTNAFSFVDINGAALGTGNEGFRFGSNQVYQGEIAIGAGEAGVAYINVAMWNDGVDFSITSAGPIANGSIGSLDPSGGNEGSFDGLGSLDFGARNVGIVAIEFDNRGGAAYSLTYDYGGSGDQKLHAVSVVLIPEPSRTLLLAAGLGFLALRRRR